MDAGSRLVKFCDDWWSGAAVRETSDVEEGAESFLQMLDWSETTRMEYENGAMRVCRLDDSSALTFVIVGPGVLESPSSVIERGLDFCPGSRRAAGTARMTKARYVCITDFYRFYLYDLQLDELLLYSDSPARFRMEMYVEVMREAVADGSLDELRRDPKSYVARQLRAWCGRCAESIKEHDFGGEEVGEALIDRLLILGYLIHHGPKAAQKEAVTDALRMFASGRFDSEGSGQSVYRLMRHLGERFGVELLSPDPQLEMLFEDAPFGDNLAREFSLLSRSKFSIPAILESFNYGDAQEKMRVRIVPEHVESRDDQLSKHSANSIDELQLDVDLVEEGYRAVGHWFDKLMRTYERVTMEFTATHPQPQRRSEDALLEWSERDASMPMALHDPYAYAVERGLKIMYASPRQHRIGRLMLYIHLLDRMARANATLRRLPKIEDAFTERPRLLESEKGWMKGHRDDEATREWGAM